MTHPLDCDYIGRMFGALAPSVNGAEAGDWSNRKWEMMDKSRLGSLRGIWLAGGGRGLRKTGDAWTPDFWEYRVDVLLATCTGYRICHKTGRQLLPFSKQALARLDTGKGDRCTSKVGFACDLVDGDIGEHCRIHTRTVL